MRMLRKLCGLGPKAVSVYLQTSEMESVDLLRTVNLAEHFAPCTLGLGLDGCSELCMLGLECAAFFQALPTPVVVLHGACGAELADLQLFWAFCFGFNNTA